MDSLKRFSLPIFYVQLVMELMNIFCHLSSLLDLLTHLQSYKWSHCEFIFLIFPLINQLDLIYLGQSNKYHEYAISASSRQSNSDAGTANHPPCQIEQDHIVIGIEAKPNFLTCAALSHLLSSISSFKRQVLVILNC